MIIVHSASSSEVSQYFINANSALETPVKIGWSHKYEKTEAQWKIHTVLHQEEILKIWNFCKRAN